MMSAGWQQTADQEIAMRRADRLFQIIQILRRSGRRPVTASHLATELEVSQRSVYRDIADLMGRRVPIRGEAGLARAARDLISKISSAVPRALAPIHRRAEHRCAGEPRGAS